MVKHFVLGVAAGTALWMLTPAESKWQREWPTEAVEATPHMAVYQYVRPPPVFLDFCARFRDQCEPTAETEWDVTPERLMQLFEVNHSVNHSMQAVLDQDLYGVSDYWTIPIVPYGDCEDYALVKRKRLMELGWPSNRLLMSLAIDNGEGHAVLIAVTPNGDLVLANEVADIRPWHETPYQFVSRQSNEHPREWRSLLRYADHWGGYGH